MKCSFNAQCITTFLTGFLFSIGLCLSGMTEPAKVISFLDIAGDWDPSLMLVMAGAVSVYFIGFRLIMRRSKPVYSPAFALPTRMDIDGKLITGALLFGTGWGLSGFCPGPALVSLTTLHPSAVIFVVSMTLGMYVYGTIDSRVTDQAEPDGGMGVFEAIEFARSGKIVGED